MGSSSKLGHDLDFSASFQRKVLAQLVAQFLAILGQPRLFRVIPTKSPGPLLSKTGPKLGHWPTFGPGLRYKLGQDFSAQSEHAEAKNSNPCDGLESRCHFFKRWQMALHTTYTLTHLIPGMGMIRRLRRR